MTKKRKGTTPLTHYLVSWPLIGGHVHGYVMTAERTDVMRVLEVMIEAAEKRKIPPSLVPVALITPLDDGWQLVREIISANGGSGPAAQWTKAKDFHYTVFFMAQDHPDNRRLLDLH